MAWFSRKPKIGYPIPDLGGAASPEVQKFLDDHEAFFDEHNTSVAKLDEAVEQILAAAEKHKGDRDGLLAALTLAVQHLEARHADRKNKIAEWLARLAKITAVVIAVMWLGTTRVHVEHRELAVAQNFTLSSVN